MDEVNISIIMPVYNAEKYLGETLQSILKQTYKDFEILCINDASIDTSLEILKNFQCVDKRIRILENNEHSGAALSRNVGIREAKGKYITFLDGDDIFEEEMLELAYRAMERYDVDIVMYEYMHVSSEHIYERRCIQRRERFVEKYCNSPFSIRACEPIEFMNWKDGPCNKLYKRSFIISNKLEFQTLPSSNDVYFVQMALLLSEKIIALNDRRVMLYARDHDEPTRISRDRDPMCVYRAMVKLGQELIARKVFSEVFQHYYCRVFYALKASIYKTKKSENARLFYEFLQKEGINNLASLSYDCYTKIDSYIYGLLENFKKLDFSTGWYKNESILDFYLYKNAHKVISLFQSYEKNHMTVAIWGIGRNGRKLLNFLHNNNLSVNEVVDKSENKCGEIVNGYKIRKPDEVIERIQVVVVCSLNIYEEVISELQGKKVDVVNIEDVVGMV